MTLSLAHVDLSQHVYTVGGGAVGMNAAGVRLTVGPTADGSYSDAQLDDYHHDGVMRWRPPLRLTVRARFSHGAGSLRGTAGFGLWNDPVGMTGRRRWRLPQAAWFFFGGPDCDMPWRLGVQGHGWKAATVDAGRPLVPVLLPGAPIAALAMRWRWVYRRLWPPLERLLGIDEALLTAELREWHDYTLDWQPDRVTFTVDGETVLATRSAPRGPLGLVVWIDNQYMIATPQGHFAQGTVDVGEQWLELAALELTAPV